MNPQLSIVKKFIGNLIISHFKNYWEIHSLPLDMMIIDFKL